ncbi:MAG: PLP-dependent aminotransferase family protein, partial [bacterium]|nr:PLP-dependent aminotransferase family protein [bacterium]
EALSLYFPASEPWSQGVRWRKPNGGFFQVIDIPFPIDDALLKKCVEEYSVIVCPMSFFCLNEAAGGNQVRLAFSNLPADGIRKGIRQLAQFIKDHVSA